MSVSLAGRAPTTFEIKSANLPLVALWLKSPDLEQLTRELAERYGDIPDFFDQDPLVIELSPLAAEPDDSTIDFPALLALLRGHRLQPLAVRGGSAAQQAAARAAGLVCTAEPVLVRRPTTEDSAAPANAPAPTATAPEPTAVPDAPLSALVIERPLRSGQQVYARGRDVVVMAMVNPGAEVIADGHIHVYAPLRGRAIAGARGDTSARIFALEMQPELISIAGVYRTTETPLAPEVWGKPAMIHLTSDDAGDKLVVAAIAG